MEIKEVILIGSGNVSWHLAKTFHHAGIRVVQVAGRNENAVKEIAQNIGAAYTTNFADVADIDGIYLLLVTDASIAEVAARLYKPGRKLVHCSGGVSKDALLFDTNTTGVFYPVLSFNKAVEIDIASAIICVDSNDASHTEALFKLGKKLTHHVHVLNDEQRLRVNLGAVFVNNFTNHLYTIAEDLLKKNGMQLSMLMPLIESSVKKIKNNSPHETQTGPAKRGEQSVMEKHLTLLADNPEYAAIYKLLSYSITNTYQNT